MILNPNTGLYEATYNVAAYDKSFVPTTFSLQLQNAVAKFNSVPRGKKKKKHIQIKNITNSYITIFYQSTINQKSENEFRSVQYFSKVLAKDATISIYCKNGKDLLYKC